MDPSPTATTRTHADARLRADTGEGVRPELVAGTAGAAPLGGRTPTPPLVGAALSGTAPHGNFSFFAALEIFGGSSGPPSGLCSPSKGAVMRYTTNWHQRATRDEIDEVAALDRSIADLRLRRQAILNRTKFRTSVWIARHGDSDGRRGISPRRPRLAQQAQT